MKDDSYDSVLNSEVGCQGSLPGWKDAGRFRDLV